MTEQQTNAALRTYLLEPLSDEQRAALSAHTHFIFGSKLLDEALELTRRNSKLPCNFTTSLDACRLVENRLSDVQRHAYAARLMRETMLGWAGLGWHSPRRCSARRCCAKFWS